MSGNGNLAGHRIIVKQYSLHYQCHTEEETPLHHTGQCSGCQILTWKHCNKYFLVHYEKLCVAYPKSETNSTLIDLSWKRNHISVNTYMFTYLSIMNDSLGRCSGRSVSQVDRKSSLKIYFLNTSRLFKMLRIELWTNLPYLTVVDQIHIVEILCLHIALQTEDLDKRYCWVIAQVYYEAEIRRSWRHLPETVMRKKKKN